MDDLKDPVLHTFPTMMHHWTGSQSCSRLHGVGRYHCVCARVVSGISVKSIVQILSFHEEHLKAAWVGRNTRKTRSDSGDQSTRTNRIPSRRPDRGRCGVCLPLLAVGRTDHNARAMFASRFHGCGVAQGTDSGADGGMPGSIFERIDVVYFFFFVRVS